MMKNSQTLPISSFRFAFLEQRDPKGKKVNIEKKGTSLQYVTASYYGLMQPFLYVSLGH